MSKAIVIKDMIATFIDTVILMEAFSVSFDDLYRFIKSVNDECQLTSLVTLILFCHGKDSVSVKENLELDSTEIKLIKRLFIDSKDILQLTEELMFYVTCFHMSEASDLFVKQRLNLMFDTEVTQ